MWYLRFKVKHSDCIIAPLAEKYNLAIEYYPLGSYVKGKYVYTSAIHTAKGKEENIKKYLKDLKKHPKILKVEISKVIFTLAKEKADFGTYQALYNSKLFYLTPGFNTPDGFEQWEIACWERKPLEELINIIEKTSTTEHFEILEFKEKDIDDVYILQLFPQLPKKQKQAIELAYKEGYYQFPKKTNLEKLAKLQKVSKQTFQEHLKKAESKLMPLLLRKQ